MKKYFFIVWGIFGSFEISAQEIVVSHDESPEKVVVDLQDAFPFPDILETSPELVPHSTNECRKLFRNPPPTTVDINLISIGSLNNPAGPGGEGRVTYRYRIGRYEVTNAEYAAFLNAVAFSDDPLGLYKQEMALPPHGGIRRIDCQSRFFYVPNPQMRFKPVNYVRWHDAARFVNWLSEGSTEIGTYDLRGEARPIYLQALRQPEARWALATASEFIKAARYDRQTFSYFAYATQSNEDPEFGFGLLSSANAIGHYLFPGFNQVNYGSMANWNGSSNGNVTEVGSCASESPWGTYDQNGNVSEWTEQIVCLANLCGRNIRGGSFATSPNIGSSSEGQGLNGLRMSFAPASTLEPGDPYGSPEEFYRADVGFRVVAID